MLEITNVKSAIAWSYVFMKNYKISVLEFRREFKGKRDMIIFNAILT